MSMAPSYPLDRVLWSIQTLVEYCTLIASSFHPEKVMFRMMTLLALETLSPHPVSAAPALPRIDLFEPTVIMPEQEMLPEIRTTRAVVPETALDSAEELVTVVAAALPPPVVPPPWVAQPTRPVLLPPPPPPGVVGVVPPPEPTWISCHCWFAPLRSANCETMPPSATDHCHMSSALLLCRLMNRTFPLSESTKRKCCLVSVLAVVWMTCTPSLALGTATTLPLLRLRNW